MVTDSISVTLSVLSMKMVLKPQLLFVFVVTKWIRGFEQMTYSVAIYMQPDNLLVIVLMPSSYCKSFM